MDEKRQDGKSNFNALQLSLHRRVAKGLNLGAEYMWSHSINDGNLGGGEGAQPQIAACRADPAGTVAAMLHLVHDTLNIMSMIGVILLMGLVTKNAILVIDFANTQRRAV